MKKEKQINLLLPVGLFCMFGSLFLRYFQMPDFIKGLIFGIGMGLVILFIIRKNRPSRFPEIDD
jgi:hypothetical protein